MHNHILQIKSGFQEETEVSEMDLVDINIRAAIAFGLAMTVALLTYIAFFKKSSAG